MIAQEGQPLVADEVLALPSWDEEIRPFIKQRKLHQGGASGLYKKLLERARDLQRNNRGRSNCICRRREIQKSSGSQINVTYTKDTNTCFRWNDVLRKLVQERQHPSKKYKWMDECGRPLFPKMEHPNRKGRIWDLCFVWSYWTKEESELATWIAVALQAPQVVARLGSATSTQLGTEWVRHADTGTEHLVFTATTQIGNAVQRRLLLEKATEISRGLLEANPHDLSAAIHWEDSRCAVGNELVHNVKANVVNLFRQPANGSLFAPDSGSQLLMSRAAYQDLKYSYHTEPLHEVVAPVTYTDAIDSPVYRLWSHARPQFATDPAIEEATSLAVQLGDRGNKVIAIPCFSNEEATLWTHSLIQAASHSPHNCNPLLLSCHTSRQWDLLNPFIEAIRDEVNLNRMVEAVDSRGRLGHLVAKYVKSQLKRLDSLGIVHRESIYQERCQLLELLLLGVAPGTDSYEAVVDDLTLFIESLALVGDVTSIIVSNVHEADPATVLVLERIVRGGKIPLWMTYDPRRGGRLASLGLSCASEPTKEVIEKVQDHLRSGQMPNWDLSPIESEVLRCTVVFGWDCLRSWVANLVGEDSSYGGLTESGDSIDENKFQRAYASLLSKGILRVSGRLSDVSGINKSYRELKFTSPWAFAWASDTTRPNDDYKRRLRTSFCRILRERLSEYGERGVSMIRRKRVVSEIVGRATCKDITDAGLLEPLIELSVDAAKRAAQTGLHKEILNRLRPAMRVLFNNATGLSDQLSERLIKGALEVLRIALANSHAGDCDRGDKDSLANDVSYCAQGFLKSVDECWIESQLQIPLFDCTRALWAYQLHFARNLSEASETIELLDEEVKHTELDSVLYGLEVHHLKVVTYFASGKWDDALNASREGVKLCIQRKNNSGDRTFGSHCGGGCCKIFGAMLTALRATSGDDVEDAIHQAEEAVKYVDSLHDKSSQIVVRAYYALMHLLVGNGISASAASLQIVVDPSHDANVYVPLSQKIAAKALNFQVPREATRWHLMAKLVWLSTVTEQLASVGAVKSIVQAEQTEVFRSHFGVQDLATDEPAGVIRRVFGETIEEWGDSGLDYVPLWRAYQALLLKEVEESRDALRCARKMAQYERGEHFCVPEIARLQASVELRRNVVNPEQKALEYLQEGIAKAKELGANLIVTRLEREASKLRERLEA